MQTRVPSEGTYRVNTNVLGNKVKDNNAVGQGTREEKEDVSDSAKSESKE